MSRKSKLWLLISLLTGVPAAIVFGLTSPPVDVPIVILASQAISSLFVSGSSTTGSFTANTPNALVGPIAVTMSPSSPPFSGTVTLDGAPNNTEGFHLSSNTLPSNLLAPAGGLVASPPSYTDVVIRAQQTNLADLTINPVLTATVGPPPSSDEFIGPLAGWINVRNAPYNAVGNGVADDTAALQAAFDAVGVGSNSYVVWIPAGTYKITATLNIATPRLYISILGEDPATTTIKWGGAPTATNEMLNIDGVAYSRFSRLTFDGSNSQVIGVNQSYSGITGNFDTGNEYADDTFKNAAFGIQCGMRGYACAEASVIRGNFINLTTAGIITGNPNALDFWIRYSVFDHCYYGVTNYLWVPALNDFRGDGNFHVHNSIFRNTIVHDIEAGHLDDGTFSIRNNYSIGAGGRFLDGNGSNNPAGQSIQGNTILDTGDPISINIFNQGPVLMYDNVIRSKAGVTTGPVMNLYSPSDSDAITIGNTFTVTNPISVSPGRLDDIDTSVVNRNTINPSEPVLPGTELNLHRPIIEVANNSTDAQIQTAINTAVSTYSGQRPVVHIPSGTYYISTTLTIPANSDVQLVGDGASSWLIWNGGGTGPVISVVGPTKATFRELLIDGNTLVQGLVAKNIDQPGSRVYTVGLELRDGVSSDLFYDGLDYTVMENVDFQSLYERNLWVSGTRIGVKVVGGPLAAAGTPATGKLNIYSGLAAEKGTAYQVTNGGNLLIRTVYYENGVWQSHLQVLGRATVTLEGQKQTIELGGTSMDILDLIGKTSILGLSTGGNIVIRGNGSQAQVLAAGVFEETMDLANFFIPSASPAATSGLLQSRVVTSQAGVRTIPVANQGTIDNTFVKAMFAQTRAATEQPPAPLAAGVSDLRLYRVSIGSSLHNFHLIGTQASADMYASPLTVLSSQPSTVTWNSVNATSCTGTGFSTGGAANGSASVSPTITTTYSINCTGAGSPGTASVTVTVAAPGDNVVGNPDFETGTLSPWFMGGVSVVPSNPHTGTYAAHLLANGSGIYQTLNNLVPGSPYVLTGWGKVTTSAGGSVIGVNGYGGADQYAALNADGSYHQSSPITFTPTGTTALIFGYSNGDSVYVDDFDVHIQ